MKTTRTVRSVSKAASPSKELAGFLAKYDPAVAKQARAARTALRKRLPTALELVYDNYQFLAIGYSTPSCTTGPQEDFNFIVELVPPNAPV